MKQFGNLKAPENWNEITIEQLIQLQKIEHLGETTEANIKAVHLFNVDTNVLACDFDNLISALSQIFAVVSTMPKDVQKITSYSIDGQVYNVVNAENINVGDFVDVNALNENESERVKNMPLIISILTRDKGKHADTKAWAEKIQENVSVLTGMGILVFFSENLMTYLRNTPYYSQIITKMEENKEKKA
jgi:hypothetical protein